MNASIYVWKASAFRADPRVFYRDTRLFEMPPERSHDIDSELDFQIVAEQVEDQESFETLRSLGVDFVQGFVVERPRALQAVH